VLTHLLRHDLGFDGLVVTDALVMEAIAAHVEAGEAAVQALEAGADLVLMPADPWRALEAIVSAVRDGRLSAERLRASLGRRLRALERVGARRAVDDPSAPLGSLSNGPAQDDRELAAELLSRMLHHQGGTVRLPPQEGALALLRVDDQLGCRFLSPDAPALALPRAAGFRPWVIDDHGPPDGLPKPVAGGSRLPPWTRAGIPRGPVLLQLFVRGNPFRGSASGTEPWTEWIQELLHQGRLAGLVVYGSPYLWQRLRETLPAGLPAAFSPGQMPEAQTLALGRLGLGPTVGGGGFTD
jgi:beta-glucosidase